MVRGLAVVSVFLLCVIALIVMQPGLSQKSPLETALSEPTRSDEAAVTRDQVNLLAEVSSEAAPNLEQLVIQAINAEALDTRIAASEPVQAPAPVSARQSAVEGMTWAVLRDLNGATGRGSTPGAPGSLLQVLVTRSLTEAEGHLSAEQRAYISALAQEADAAF